MAPSMNYRRGLFRFWVLASILWVAGVAFVTGSETYRALFPETSRALARQGGPVPGTLMLPVK